VLESRLPLFPFLSYNLESVIPGKEIPMQIVTAQENHISEILNLWEEFVQFHKSFDPRFPMKDDVRSSYETELRGAMAAKDTRVVVALDDGTVVGYVLAVIRKSSPAWQRERYGYIEDMAVTASCRHHGTGTQMLEKILDWFKSENLDMIELSVASKNTVGYSFWKKHGFKDYLHHLYLKP
jgi:ribosomal protein S18 acetylase RimI-like enzyme